MATTNFASLLEKLKPEDPWLPPVPWESIPSESGRSSHSTTSTSHCTPLYDTTIVTESSLVRLAINALQGMESAVITIEKLCAAFYADPADRSFHRIPSIWKRTSSTLALGKILKSIGCSGCVVFLLGKFVDHTLSCNKLMSVETDKNQNDSESKLAENRPKSLVNQAFSIAVRKVLEGYLAALDTLYASVDFRRSSETLDNSSCSSFGVGRLMSSEHSEITLLEVYLHSKELRTQIEVLGSICQILDVAFYFSGSSFEDLISKAYLQFLNFPRGGDLLTYLYSRLRVADPVHSAVLKFLFLRSCEPYCDFIRSWIYKSEISDPYNEFMVEYAKNLPSYSPNEAGSSYDIWLATVKEREGVLVPCFLKDMLIPIFRAGQQLQVLMKLLELCGHITTENHSCGGILPCWSDFSSDYSSHASPFTFSRGSIEALVLARSNYYTRMMEKMNTILKKLEIRFQQVISNGNAPAFMSNCGDSRRIPILFRKSDGLISPTTDERDLELVVDSLDSEASSTMDDFSYLEHQLDSSDCSSVDGSEDKNESLQIIQLPKSLGGLEQKYLSALDLVSSGANDNYLQMTCERGTLNPREGDSSEIYGITDAKDILTHPCFTETNLSSNHLYDVAGKPNWSWLSETQCRYNLCNTGLLSSGVVKNPFHVRQETIFHPSECGLKMSSRNTGVLKEAAPYLNNMILGEYSLTDEINVNHQYPSRGWLSSNPFCLQVSKLKSISNPLSMKPLSFKSDLIRKREERFCADHTKPLPSFDFSSVKDPCKIHENSFAASPKHHFGAVPTFLKNSNASAAIDTTKFHDEDCYVGHETVKENHEFSHANFTLASENNKKDDVSVASVSGGSSWESMLACFGNTINTSARDCKKRLVATFDIPVDYVIEKCLLQEILYQYWYVSKFTIKLLEEGFNLREHLSALRRYHFMELADWADLFIVSLWHRKWHAMEADRKVSEIQRLLAMSVQKSSCERDDCKNRLFVYMKGNGTNMVPLLTRTIGIDSFDFLGLGYKVDWPVSIVLTPGALEIYARIFSFLIRVKLATYSLTDTWCSLKDLLHFNSQSCYSKARRQEKRGPQSEMYHLNTLMTFRHQVSHFVTTLQQYVQSQLSLVSWCRFIDSLQNKVKDMMDLESAHMAYLTDSLHICLLSDEMKVVASIVENILQCALDLRSCLIGANCGGQLDGGFPGQLSRVNISQVLAVKQTFEKNLAELHICYLKAPKHREFGFSHFWVYLNYNEYYSDSSDERSYYGFSM